MLRHFAAAVFAASLLIQPLDSQESRPRFEDFPVTENWAGPSVKIKISSPQERLFRTRLLMAGREQPNFAGHFVATSWGCGSNCAQGAVVDLETGNVLKYPMERNTKQPVHMDLCNGAFGPDGVRESRRDSRLLIIRCGLNWDVGIEENRPDEYYFVIDGHALKLIRHIHHAVTK
jgi:hypothetical protein